MVCLFYCSDFTLIRKLSIMKPYPVKEGAKILNREAWKIAFAYTGVVVGAGFSTGQEILQFFTNHGCVQLFGHINIRFDGFIHRKTGNEVRLPHSGGIT